MDGLFSNVWVAVAIVAAWLGLVLLSAEWLSRRPEAEPEQVRKVVHIGSGNVILLAWWLNIPAWIGVTAAILAGGVTLLSYQMPILASINSVGRRSLGTFFYALSIGLLIAYFWSTQPQYAAIGVLVMTWGDGLAALIGKQFGRHPYKLWGMEKSWEGSSAMAVTSYIVCSVILLIVQGNSWQVWLISLVVAIGATALEAFSKYGIDNLTVPLGSAALTFLLNQALTRGSP